MTDEFIAQVTYSALEYFERATVSLENLAARPSDIEQRLSALEKRDDVPKRGTWAWACEQMLEGKRARFPDLQVGNSVGLEEGELRDAMGNHFLVWEADMRRVDWELAE